MKILMVNKFLFPNGGSETYIFKLGNFLKEQGHEVQYFGMEHEGRCVGNAVDAYTSDMNFHNASAIQKIRYSLKTIYSSEARKKIRMVLDDFKPDVVHLNNFNFQLTPSIILEIRSFEKKIGKKVKIVFTAHDYQLVCPNHMMKNVGTNEPCAKCLSGTYINCLKQKCIHGSAMKSAIGMIEAYYWKIRKTYREIDVIISPSYFLAERISHNPDLDGRIEVFHNFIDTVQGTDEQTSAEQKPGDYVLYFGRYSEEKGIGTLLEVVKRMPDIPFVFAGSGPLEEAVNGISNIQNKGFLKSEEIYSLIQGARFTVIPSEWYENCPFSVMESQMCGTPVLGADIGGIPELIDVGNTGELFESGNAEELEKKIKALWETPRINIYKENCRQVRFDTLPEYYEKLMKIYNS